MKQKFYKHCPAIMAIGGAIVGYLFSYGLNFLQGWSKWTFVIVCNSLIWFCMGNAIIKLSMGVYIDSLTGLHNRLYFYEKIKEEMQRLKRNPSWLSIAVIDIDKFKHINDTYGHLEGDKVLKQLARIIKNNVREIDTAARWGGEEFTLILPGTDSKGACIAAERIRQAVEQYNFGYKVTISVGTGTTNEEISIDELTALADKALYKAKENRNEAVCLDGAEVV